MLCIDNVYNFLINSSTNQFQLNRVIIKNAQNMCINHNTTVLKHVWFVNFNFYQSDSFYVYIFLF